MIINIYALIDPETKEPRYVGKTHHAKLRNRLWQHNSDVRKTYKTHWVQTLRRKGLRPIIELIVSVPIEEADKTEKYYIDLYKKKGYKMTNLTDGGPGSTGRIVPLDKRFNSKPVWQFTLEGTFVKEWFSAKEAERNGFSSKQTSRCCNRNSGRVSYKGFQWRFKHDANDVQHYNPATNLKRRKSVLQFASDGITLIKEWSSPVEVEEITGIRAMSIINAINTNIRHNGFVWKYK